MIAREAPRQRLRKPTIISNSKIRINITHTKVMGAIITVPELSPQHPSRTQTGITATRAPPSAMAATTTDSSQRGLRAASRSAKPA